MWPVGSSAGRGAAAGGHGAAPARGQADGAQLWRQEGVRLRAAPEQQGRAAARHGRQVHPSFPPIAYVQWMCCSSLAAGMRLFKVQGWRVRGYNGAKLRE
jgi:hypothetical protein